MASLEGAFGAGFKDYAALRNDPDLESLQGPGLEKLIQQAMKDTEGARRWRPFSNITLPKF